MSDLLPLPFLLPLLGAALSTLVGRSRRAQRVVGVVTLTAVAALSVVLAVAADDRSVVVAQAGGWRAPIGITLVLDRLSATMLAVASLTLLAVLVFTIGHRGADNHHVGFQSVYLVLAAGVALSFLTGDLFTLFVAFEVMLTASYVLITFGGTVAYTLHHIVAMTTLFLVGGLISHAGGTGSLARLGLMVRRAPVVAALFLVAALGLAGVPPTSGFVPKLGLVTAGLAPGTSVVVRLVTVVSLLTGLLTLFSMMKIWIGAFWSTPDGEPEEAPRPVGRLGGPPLMVLPTAALLGVSLGFAAAMGPLYALCQRIAADLDDPSRYVRAVLG